MGQSASAYLAFGFELPDELPEIFNGNDSFDNGINVVPFGYGYEGKFLSARTFNGDWNGPEGIPHNAMEIKPQYYTELVAFCKQYGIEYKIPAWNLMAHLA